MSEKFKTVYGVDATASRIIIVRGVRRGVSQPLLVAAPDSEEARRLLERLAGEVEKGAAALAVSAPAIQTVIRPLRAPFASVKKAGKVWDSLLDVNLPFPVESASCCYSDVHVEAGGTRAVASAIRRSDLESFDAACEATGFSATHCDAEALALWSQQGIEAPPVRSERPRAIVWLGEDHVTIARGRGTTFMAAHVLRASPMAESEETRKAFDTLWSARIRQILVTHLAETESSEMDLWWAGPGAEDEARVTRLQKAMPSDIPLRQEIHLQPASFLARAVAGRARNGTGINFKADELLHPAVRHKQEKALIRAYAGVVGAALLVLLLNKGISEFRQYRIDSLQKQLSTAARAITGYEVPLGFETNKVKIATIDRDKDTRAFRNALDPDGMEGRFARFLEEAAVHDIDVSQLKVSPLAISIEGSAPNIQAIEGLAEQMRAKGWSVPTPKTLGRTEDGDDEQFILEGTANHEG